MKLLSLDVETSGEKEEYALQPWRVKQRKSWITTCAFTFRDADTQNLITRGIILDPDGTPNHYERTRSQLRKILQFAIDGGYRVVGWNVTFDLAWIIAYDCWDLVEKIKWFDAMRIWRHLNSFPTFDAKNKMSYSLDNANQKYEKAYAGYKVEGKRLYHDPSLRPRLCWYNKQDTEVTLLHCERFWPQLTTEQQHCVLIEASCLDLVARANVTGMEVNIEARNTLDATLRKVGHEIAETLAPLGVTEAIVRSPKRLATLLYKKWGLPVLKENEITDAMRRGAEKRGVEPVATPSTDKEVLHELGLEDKRVLNVQLWREALNLNSKFMGGLKKSIEYNEEGNRTYPQAVVYSTYTSRMTYNSKQTKAQNSPQVGFAIHQMKRDPRFRNCIVAPQGHLIVELDAASQEFKWMAIKSGDPTMLKLCMPGEDPHSYMAAQIFERDYREFRSIVKDEKHPGHKEASKQRKPGKVGNLSLQYRTSQRRFRITARVDYGIDMSADEAQVIWHIYRQTYPGVPIYWRSQIQLGKEIGYAETLAGRRVQIDGDWTGEMKWAMESTMINYPIQGTGGEQKYLAMRCVRNILSKYDAVFAWDLHDGLYFYVPEKKAVAFAREAQFILDNLPYDKAWGFKSPVPLNWDCKLGPAWGSLTEQHFG